MCCVLPNNMFWIIVLTFLLSIRLNIANGCRFGDEPNCAFRCRCTNNKCNSETGTCLESICNATSPPGYGWGDDGCLVGNIAYNKQANQSGIWSVFDASRAIDGNISPYIIDENYTGSCAHPLVSEGGYAWWMLDMQGIFNVINITIYNRQDVDKEVYDTTGRNANIEITIGNTSDALQHTRCLHQNEKMEHISTLVCDQGNMVGRYLNFRRTGGWQPYTMHLCEVVVMGYLHIDCSGCKSTCDNLLGCVQCPRGKMLPDCVNDCLPGYWGVNCRHRCTTCECGETCDGKTGKCYCGLNETSYVDSVSSNNEQRDEIAGGLSFVGGCVLLGIVTVIIVRVRKHRSQPREGVTGFDNESFVAFEDQHVNIGNAGCH